MDDLVIWLGIVFCVTQSAMFSGLNLAFFSFTRLRLEIESEGTNSEGAKKILRMRKDSNFLLTTILWGNVGINVLLTLLSDSVLFGLSSFLFSTVVITLFGEIVPQAYFSRHSLRMASLLAPILRFYQMLLYPVAKPSALLLDAWLGKESIEFLKEQNIKTFLQKHVEGVGNEIDPIEGIGAINFLSLDDKFVYEEGEPIHPKSIVSVQTKNGLPLFPKYTTVPEGEFINKINVSRKKWVIFVDEEGQPISVLDADGFIREVVLKDSLVDIHKYCHQPIIISDETEKLDSALKKLRSEIEDDLDHSLDHDIILFWSEHTKRIITGADILGYLLKGI